MRSAGATRRSIDGASRRRRMREPRRSVGLCADLRACFPLHPGALWQAGAERCRSSAPHRLGHRRRRGVARRLSALIDAPLVLSGYSRLLIDCNRPLGSATSIPAISESNGDPRQQRHRRRRRRRACKLFHAPFQTAHRALTSMNAPLRTARPSSWAFTASRPCSRASSGRGTPASCSASRSDSGSPWSRPWFGRAQRCGERALHDRGRWGLHCPVHGERRGLDAVLVEIRQDLIADDDGAKEWALRLAEALPRA